MFSPSSTSKSSLGSLGHSQHRNRARGFADGPMIGNAAESSQDLPGSPSSGPALERKIADLHFPELKPLVWGPTPKPAALSPPMKRSLCMGSPQIVQPPMLKRVRFNKMIAGPGGC